ncbi:MAG: LacI family DNA-binding transcriptional regulator [Bacillota bacterium]|jgi:LacI family transcriptional regulator/LacI family purine nucleotide synthesis repressor|nr:LacI family DNA-binding transcriptional regulator [Bacillota bacterium]
MPATLKDVARRSGFSVTTVSRALNGHSDVNIETRKKIEQAARELNYFPNRMAQQLVTRKTNAIGLYSLDRETFQNQFIALMISGMMDEATTHDFNLLLFATQRLMTAEEMVIQCKQRGLGGAVISGLRTDEAFIAELPAVEFPIVLVDVPVEGPRATYVSVNNVLGARSAVEHLASLGHTAIGMINGHDAAWVSQERLQGYKEGLLQHGLQIKDSYIYTGDFSKESGRRGAEHLLAANPELTAIFAASDLMAVGALEQLQAMGLEVPGHISVVGFDDQDFANHVSPPLTTIRQDMYVFGRLAARELIAMIEDTAYTPHHVDLPCTLVPRGSSGPVGKTRGC